MTADDLKLLLAILGGALGVAGFFYTVIRNRNQDVTKEKAEMIEVMITGWNMRVQDLVKANEECEERRQALAIEVETTKRVMGDKIDSLETQITTVRLDARRDLASLYTENDKLRDRVRELERARGV